jgi:DNA-3-methyladenine glycosylase I
MDDVKRCFGTGDRLMADYHDHEWGIPLLDDRALFEMLVLEGFQAGLSWRTILHKRENFRRAFDHFDPERVARYGRRDVNRLLRDAGIVRNRLKIEAAISNARAVLDLQDHGPLSDYLWGFTGNRVLRGRPARSWTQIPTHTPVSDAMAKELKAHGFHFVGTTICYAFMQSVGMVDDHLLGCHRYSPADRLPGGLRRSVPPTGS